MNVACHLTAFLAPGYFGNRLFSSQSIRRFLSVAAIFALALMVILLGAAAKHAQYQDSLHHTPYLAKAVKMVYSGADAGIPADTPPIQVIPEAPRATAFSSLPISVSQLLPPALISTPLLV